MKFCCPPQLCCKKRQAKVAEPEKKYDNPILCRADDLRREGNECCNHRQYADACNSYTQGLQAMKELPEDSDCAKEATEMRKVLHLNLAISYLHQGDAYRSFADNGLYIFAKDWEKCMRAAIENSDAAIAIDPECDKAYLRRGTARNALSFNLEDGEEFASAAREDLQKALELSPDSKPAKRQLGQRSEEDARRQEVRQFYYQDAVSSKSHRLLISMQGILCLKSSNRRYNSNLDLRAGRCVALFAEDKSDTSEVAKILSGELESSYDESSYHRVIHHGMLVATPGRATSTAAWVIAASVTLLIYAAGFAGLDPWHFLFANGDGLDVLAQYSICGSFVLLLVLIKLYIDRLQSKPKRHSVIRISDEDHSSDSSWSDVVSALADALPKKLLLEDRRRKAGLMLKAVGSEDLQETPYSELSLEQKQLAHVLVAFARSPDVLVCDDAFCHLHSVQQLRLLHMLRRMKEEGGMSIIYISRNLGHAQLIADSVGFLSRGFLSELGPSADVLKSPKHPDFQKYISENQANCQAHEKLGGQKDEFAAYSSDPSLSAAWLPK